MSQRDMLPAECKDLTEAQMTAATNIANKTGKGLANACLHVRNPTMTGLTYFKKRGREEGGRKTRRKHKKRHQKKSRRNYK